jgi:hypothetical protein
MISGEKVYSLQLEQPGGNSSHPSAEPRISSWYGDRFPRETTFLLCSPGNICYKEHEPCFCTATGLQYFTLFTA